MNTIFAQSSAPGKAGITVYRISGPNSIKALEKLTNHSIQNTIPRKMYLRKIFDPKNKQLIDEAMVVYFNANSSFTGEESVEINTHGSIAVSKLLNQALISIDDLRLAEPGEFAKRAFLNGKLDLTAAEGLADLIEAETKAQAKQALRQMGGALEKLYSNWRKQLLKIMSLFEAYIDFPDEEIPDEILLDTENNIKNLCTEIQTHVNDNHRGERLRHGLKLAIIGAPNVGKSSLMNYLLERQASIVSEVAGTTRDVIEGHLDIGGYPIILQDTAGIRENSNDKIEQIGITKAKQALNQADIKIIIHDINDVSERLDNDSDNNIIVFNKIDLGIKIDLNPDIIYISAKTGKNIDKLLNKIKDIAENLASPTEAPQITRTRHRAQLSKVLETLLTINIKGDLVLAAEDVRICVRYLENITGVITVDEILGEIFSNFCIGK